MSHFYFHQIPTNSPAFLRYLEICSCVFMFFILIIPLEASSQVKVKPDDRPPASCSTVKTDTYCGCLWRCENGPLNWSGPDDITEFACDKKPTVCSTYKGTKYYKIPAVPEQDSYCICPVQPGDSITSSSCGRVEEGQECDQSNCTVKTLTGQTVDRRCKHYTAPTCACPFEQKDEVLVNECADAKYGDMCSIRGCLVKRGRVQVSLVCEIYSRPPIALQ